jgi:ribosomal protein S27AE
MKNPFKKNDIAGVSGFIPPMPGQDRVWMCGKCGKRFTAPVSVFLLSAPKCPQCGSDATFKDEMIRY